jgi:hypothetical protein
MMLFSDIFFFSNFSHKWYLICLHKLYKLFIDIWMYDENNFFCLFANLKYLNRDRKVDLITFKVFFSFYWDIDLFTYQLMPSFFLQTYEQKMTQTQVLKVCANKMNKMR